MNSPTTIVSPNIPSNPQTLHPKSTTPPNILILKQIQVRILSAKTIITTETDQLVINGPTCNTTLSLINTRRSNIAGSVIIKRKDTQIPILLNQTNS